MAFEKRPSIERNGHVGEKTIKLGEKFGLLESPRSRNWSTGHGVQVKAMELEENMWNFREVLSFSF